MSNMSYKELEDKVYDWGVQRGIVANAKPMGQAIKALSEVQELLDAINRGSESEAADAIGDVWVCLIMCAATMDMKPMECFELAYNTIKTRTGFLRADGVFVKGPGQ